MLHRRKPVIWESVTSIFRWNWRHLDKMILILILEQVSNPGSNIILLLGYKDPRHAAPDVEELLRINKDLKDRNDELEFCFQTQSERGR